MDDSPDRDVNTKLLDDDDLEQRIASMRERSVAAGIADGNGHGINATDRQQAFAARNRRESWEIPRTKELRRRWCSCAPASLGRWPVEFCTEHFSRLDALLFTATTWIFIPAYCFAVP